jgi:hypothetical protein
VAPWPWGLAAFAAIPLRAQTPSSDWPGALKGRYRQVVDLNDAMWQEYKIGESRKINDPETRRQQ